MFTKARIKLTSFYLIIIIGISIFFSVLIYRGVTREFHRRFLAIERRLDLPIRNVKPLVGRANYFRQDFNEAQRRLLFILLYTNAAILVISGFAGYYLAGKTLAPIERALEEQKRFVADASHELRTPLTALKTSIEVALRDKKMPLVEAKKVLKSSLEDVDSLQSLSDKLLSLANYQTNNQNLTFKKIDIAHAVERGYQKILPLAKKKMIDIKVKVKGQNLLASKESLEQMLLIFLDNAVKYTTKKGRVTIETRTDRKYITLEIKDTGIGIAEEDLPHIFDRFYRADQSRSKSKVAGFGLGLSLAKRIIEIHRGSVNVTSTLGKGTSFTIKLPIGRF